MMPRPSLPMPVPPAPPLPPFVHAVTPWGLPTGPVQAAFPPAELVPPPTLVPCVTPVIPPTANEPDDGPNTILTSKIHIIREGGRARLELEDSEGACATCVRMGFKVGTNRKIHVAAGTKQVHVSGAQWKAYADEVQILDGGKRVVLSGHVKMTSEKPGCRAKMEGEDVEIILKDGSLEQIIQTDSQD
jgi:hypothetical protein